MTKTNKIIKIVERVAINNNSALSVVNICGIYYLMSFTNNENKILKELNSEEVLKILDSLEKDKTKWMDYLEMGKKID